MTIENKTTKKKHVVFVMLAFMSDSISVPMRFEKLIEASNRGHCMLCTTIGINFVVVVLLVRST